MKKKIKNTKLKPIFEVQKIAHQKYRVNPRTLQWYVTKGLIPKAIKMGREAFYDVDEKKVNVFDYIATVKLFQYIFEMSMESIKEFIDLYEKQLKLLSGLLQELSENYPIGVPLEETNWKINNIFLLMISGRDPTDLRKIKIDKIKKEAVDGLWDKDIEDAIWGRVGWHYEE